MNPALILVLFEKVLMPELLHWMERRRQADQPLPTKDEILAKLNTDANMIVAAGEEFLRSKGAL